MKKRSPQGRRQFALNLLAYGSYYYIERVAQLEKVIAKKPRSLQINLMGGGEMPPDMALLIRSILLARSPKTKLITHARSSLRNGSVLIWLLGDTRLIRDDARIFFRRADLPDDDRYKPRETSKGDDNYSDSFSEVDPDEGDHARVLELINEYLPVRELTGRFVDVQLLRQFGLLENAMADQFLANVFARNLATAEPMANQAKEGLKSPKMENGRKRPVRK